MRRPFVNLVELVHVVEVLDRMSAPSVATKALRAADMTRDMLLAGPGYIPYPAVAVTLETAARTLGERHLGVHVGRQFDYKAYSGYADYVLSAPTLGEALARASRALPLIHPGSEVTLQVRGSHAALAFTSRLETVVGYRHIAEGSLFVILQAFTNFLGDDWRPLWLEIDTEDAGAQSLLEEFMQSQLRLGTRQTALVFDMADLAATNPHHVDVATATTIHDVAARVCLQVPTTTSNALLHLFRVRKATAEFTQERAAQLLTIGSRTLQRELQSEGTCFRMSGQNTLRIEPPSCSSKQT